MHSFPNFELICCSMSSSNYCFLTCIQASQETVKVVWYSCFFQNFPQFVIHTVKCFGTVNEGEVDVLLEFPCFLWDTTNVGNLISGSSAFSKSSFWIFSVHVMLTLSLKDFQHYLASMWNKSNWVVVEHSLALIFFEIEMKTDFFQPCGQCFVFQIYWHMECSTLTALSFRILSNSAGIPSPPLTLLVVMLPFSITVIQVCAPTSVLKKLKLNSSMKTYKT